MKLSVIASLSKAPCSALGLGNLQSEAGAPGRASPPLQGPAVLATAPRPRLQAQGALRLVSGPHRGPTWGGGRGASDVRKPDQGPGAQGPRVRRSLGLCTAPCHGCLPREADGRARAPWPLGAHPATKRLSPLGATRRSTHLVPCAQRAGKAPWRSGKDGRVCACVCVAASAARGAGLYPGGFPGARTTSAVSSPSSGKEAVSALVRSPGLPSAGHGRRASHGVS